MSATDVGVTVVTGARNLSPSWLLDQLCIDVVMGERQRTNHHGPHLLADLPNDQPRAEGWNGASLKEPVVDRAGVWGL